GGHEVRHVRRGGRAGCVRGPGSAQAESERGRPDPGHREPAVRHGGQAGRRRQEPSRQDHRDHQHRCRGAAHPVRRAVVRATLQADGRDRRRDAHGGGRRRARPRGDRRDGERRDAARRGTRRRRAGRGALLAVAAVGRVPGAPEIGHCGREELGGARGRVDRGRLVPAGIRRRLRVGPPRHRRDRLHRERGAPSAQGTHGSRSPSFLGIHPEARGGVIRRRLLAGAVCLALAGSAGGGDGAAAQVDTTARRAPTAARDTAVRDTTRRDTTAVRDTTPRLLPAFAAPLPAGPIPRGTRYSFPIDSLVFTNVRTLSDLLAHVPGVYVARGGYYGQAEYVMYGGRGPGGLEIYWDGVPYLPLGRDSVYVDPARIPLAPLERVDVVVLPAQLRVYLVSARQQSTVPTSEIRILSGEASNQGYRG